MPVQVLYSSFKCQFRSFDLNASLCLSVCLPVCLSVCLSVCLYVCMYVYLSICLFVCLAVCLSVCLSVSLAVWLAVCLSLCLSACLPVFLPACLPVCPYIRWTGMIRNGAFRYESLGYFLHRRFTYLEELSCVRGSISYRTKYYHTCLPSVIYNPMMRLKQKPVQN